MDNSPSLEVDISHLAAVDLLRSTPLLGELIDVLKPHDRGLRRWSVMRAMRENRRRKSRDIPHKFEDDVERVFRQFSSNSEAPLYRPKESTGEVWALNHESAASLIVANDLPITQPGYRRYSPR